MKKKLDLNQLAKSIVEQATGEIMPEKQSPPLKGRAGGVSRIKPLTPNEKSDLGRLAASARWKKTDKN
jgi:hypothetical protein